MDGRLAADFPANDAERGTYLGVPLLVIVVLFAVAAAPHAPAGASSSRPSRSRSFAALGSWLTVNGNELTVLYPGAWLAAKPLFRNVMPVRLMLFATLAAAVMTALWAASSARPAGCASPCRRSPRSRSLPNLSWGAWARTPQVPALFTTSLYKSCIGRGENVLLLPFGTLGDSMMWQARSRLLVPRRRRLHLALPAVVVHLARGDAPHRDRAVAARRQHELGAPARAREARDDDRPRRREGRLWGRWLRPFGRPQAVAGP